MRKRKGCLGPSRVALLIGGLTGLGFSAANAALEFDLRLVQIDGLPAGNAKSAQVTHYAQVFTCDLYAKVTNAAHPTEVGFQSAQGSFRSDNEAGGLAALGSTTPAGDLDSYVATPRVGDPIYPPTHFQLVGTTPFTATGSQNGTSADLTPAGGGAGDGDLDLGSNNITSDHTGGFVAIRAASMKRDGAAIANGKEWRIGRIAFTVGTAPGSLGAGNTDLNFFIRRDSLAAIPDVSALWSEQTGSATHPEVPGAVVSLAPPVVLSRGPQWNVNGGGSWLVSGNWAGPVPGGAGAAANFLGVLYDPNTSATINLDGSRTVGQITFNNTRSYTIAGGTGGVLTLNNNASNAAIDVTSGHHTISAGLSIAAGKTADRTGAGELTISGAQTHGAASVFHALAGTTNFNSNAGGAGGNPVLSINVGTVSTPSVVNFNSWQNLAALDIKGTSTVTVGVNGDRVLDTALTIGGSLGAWTGKLDLNDNILIVRHNDPDNGATTLARVVDQIASGLNMAGEGYWDGPGICSSTAANHPEQLTGLGVMNNDDGAGAPIYTEFGGQAVNEKAILVRYTYYGDNNLDGMVDLDTDFSLFVDGYNSQGSLRGWLYGDYNYDGIIDLDTDFSLFVSGYNNQGAPLAAQQVAALRVEVLDVAYIPEPSGLCLLAASMAALTWRRRRSR
jgi:hypothetical protein